MKNFSFTTNDYLILLAYFVAVLVIGFKTKKTENSAKDYILAGRTLTLPAFVATLVSTFYGGILGVGEFSFRYGLSGWFLYAVPYYFFIIIFAFTLSSKIRKTHLYTIPDQLDKVYGKKVAVFGGILIFLLSTPAPYLFMMGILLSGIFTLGVTFSMIITLALSTLFLYKGGLRSDVRVNIFEFFVMFVGFGIILPFCFNSFGGFEYIASRLPENYLTLTGGNSFQYIIAWFFIGSWVLIDPAFHQRCYAAQSKKIPKKGVLISLVFWMIFDSMTIIAGLYSKAFFLDELKNPLYSFPAFADEILPPIAKGMFFLGMIATIMSTLHSYIFISSNSFGRDIIARIKNETESQKLYNYSGLIASSILALMLAYLLPSVINIWYTVGTLIIPPLLLSVVTSYSRKLQVHSKYIFSAMLASFLFSLLSFTISRFYIINGKPALLFGLEPMYPGLILGLIIYLIGYFKRKDLITETDYYQ